MLPSKHATSQFYSDLLLFVYLFFWRIVFFSSSLFFSLSLSQSYFSLKIIIILYFVAYRHLFSIFCYWCCYYILLLFVDIIYFPVHTHAHTPYNDVNICFICKTQVILKKHPQIERKNATEKKKKKSLLLLNDK